MSYSAKWIDILNLIKDFYYSRGIVFFRGHPDSKYELHSGLFREAHSNLDGYLISEKVKYSQYLTLGHMEHSSRGWNLLYIMQHHGVRTRLLDWTESFATALFFAYINWDITKSPSCCVWMLDPSALNIRSTNNPALVNADNYFGNFEKCLANSKHCFANSVALYPERNNKRIIAQQGLFTLQGNTLLPLEKELNDDEALIKITIDYTMIEDVKSFLQTAGVNYHTLFPDLDGLAKYVNSPVLPPPFDK